MRKEELYRESNDRSAARPIQTRGAALVPTPDERAAMPQTKTGYAAVNQFELGNSESDSDEESAPLARAGGLSVDLGAAQAAAAEKNLIVVVLISSAGNMLEWFDFAVFGFFADIFGAPLPCPVPCARALHRLSRLGFAGYTG